MKKTVLKHRWPAWQLDLPDMIKDILVLRETQHKPDSSNQVSAATTVGESIADAFCPGNAT